MQQTLLEADSLASDIQDSVSAVVLSVNTVLVFTEQNNHWVSYPRHTVFFSEAQAFKIHAYWLRRHRYIANF